MLTKGMADSAHSAAEECCRRLSTAETYALMRACRSKAETGLMAYKRDYIDTGSAKPLYDVLIYGFFFSYLIAWPQVGAK